MSVFNALVFDGINSLNYGVYITGEAVFNSPQRSVEAVTVPGRNGDVLLDLGRYENIEVTYHAGVFGADQSEFATKIRTFRNLLASRVGYKRITDTYNPNEFRMGTFIASVDVTPTSMDRHGEFDIVFNCKPQRFLTSGETKITVTNYQMINNPTLFESSPLLEVKGYGTLELAPVREEGESIELLDGYTIHLNGDNIGVITVAENSYTEGGVYVMPLGLYSGMYNSTDTITISLRSVGVHLYASPETSTWFFSTIADSTFSTEAGQGSPSVTPTVTDWRRDTNNWEMNVSVPNISFPANANFGRKTVGKVTATVPIVNGSATTANLTLTTNIEVEYIQDTLLVVYLTPTKNSTVDVSNIVVAGQNGRDGGAIISMRSTVIESTASTLGDPTYIDCDLGEAYMIRDGNYVGLNSFIDLGSDLPKLAPGKTAFIFDNTITQLKLVPRWWIL